MAIQPKPAAFDALAGAYDDDFTRSRLGQWLRAQVWETLIGHFQPGQHVLELACGTGEDAVWLAQWDLQVTATDASGEMVRVARHKINQAGLAHRVTVRQLSFQQVIDGCLADSPNSFDAVFSNFGGLNTINNWADLADQLAHCVRPDALLVLVPMGPFCPWEILWHVAHGQPKMAARRLRPGASATVGTQTIPLWYPAASRLRADFRPWFDHVETRSLGLWLPPTYLGHLVERWPFIFRWFYRLERLSAWLTGGLGDHYISIFKRKR